MRRSSKLLLFCALGCLAVVFGLSMWITVHGARLAHTELVVNGAFSADVGGWTIVNASAESIAGGAIGNAVVITNTPAWGLIRQGISVTIASVYELSLYHVNGDTGAIVYVGNDLTCSTEYALFYPGAASWTTYSQYFTPTATTVWLCLQVSSDVTGATTKFDELSIFLASEATPTPMPTATPTPMPTATPIPGGQWFGDLGCGGYPADPAGEAHTPWGFGTSPYAWGGAPAPATLAIGGGSESVGATLYMTSPLFYIEPNTTLTYTEGYEEQKCHDCVPYWNEYRSVTVTLKLLETGESPVVLRSVLRTDPITELIQIDLSGYAGRTVRFQWGETIIESENGTECAFPDVLWVDNFNLGYVPWVDHTWHDHYVTSETNFGACDDMLASVSGNVLGMDLWSYLYGYAYSLVITETASGNQTWLSRGSILGQHAGVGDYISPSIKLGPAGTQMYQAPCWPGTGSLIGPVVHATGSITTGAGGTGLDTLYLMPGPAPGEMAGYDGSAFSSAGPTAGRYLDGAWMDDSEATGWVTYRVPAWTSSIMVQLRGDGWWQKNFGALTRISSSGRDLVLIPWDSGWGESMLTFYSGAMWIGRLSLFSTTQAAPTPADPNATPTVRATNTPGWGCGVSTCTPVPYGTPQPTATMSWATPGGTPGAPPGPAPVSTRTPHSLIPVMVALPLGTPVAGINSIDDLVEVETQEFCYDFNFSFPDSATIVLPGTIAPLPNPFSSVPRQIRFCLNTLNRFSLIGINLLPGLYTLGLAMLLVFAISHLRDR
jgi:hypothetical protein